MRCSEAERLMSAMLDGDIEQSPRLDGHLEACPSCKTQWEALQRTVADLSCLSQLEAPEDLTAAVMAKLPERHALVFGKPVGFLVAGLSIAAAVILFAWATGLGQSGLTVAMGLATFALNWVAAIWSSIGVGTPGFVINSLLVSTVAAFVLAALLSVGRICGNLALAYAQRRGA